MSQSDPLRTKLKALVGELHQQAALYRRGQELSNESQALAYTQCARKLTALLAESELEPNECPPHPLEQVVQEEGRQVRCTRCGAVWLVAEKQKDGTWLREEIIKPAYCEAKAKLPLGHEFASCRVSWCQRCHHTVPPPLGLCGQPRSAHEPK